MDTIGLVEYIVVTSMLYAIILSAAYKWLMKEG